MCIKMHYWYFVRITYVPYLQYVFKLFILIKPVLQMEKLLLLFFVAFLFLKDIYHNINALFYLINYC